MWNNELTLKNITYEEDEIGNQIPIEVNNTVFCEVNSIGRNEFYNASMSGLKPSIIFIIHKYEYNEETQIEFENKNYKVIKTYEKNTDEIELTCEKVTGNV